MKQQVIALTQPGERPDEAILVNRMFEEGLLLLHVRKPGFSNTQYTQWLSAIDPRYRPRLVLPYALYQGNPEQFTFCKQLHLFEELRLRTDLSELETLSDQGFIFSTSVHDQEAYRSLPPVFTYTFFGPVFNSISKPGHKALSMQDKDLRNSKTNVAAVALGGIDLTNCRTAIAYGFDSVALLGAVWQEPDPVTAFKNIQQCFTNGR